MCRRVVRPGGSVVVFELCPGDWEKMKDRGIEHGAMTPAGVHSLLGDQFKTGAERCDDTTILDVEFQGKRLKQQFWVARYDKV